MIMLAAFRAFQGIGAGALMSVPLAIMGDMLAPRERAKYQGFFLAVFGVSAVVGPLIGGVFADAHQILWIAGWRWVFLINVPVGIGAMFMVLAFLHLPKFHKTTSPRIDWWGASAVVVTLVPLLLVAEQGREWGWTSASSITCYVIGVVGLIGFFVAETIMKADAIIPLRLFQSSTFSMSTVLGFLVGFGMFGAMLTLPLYLQLVTGLTPTESGFATLPMVGGLMIASVGSGQAIARTGKYRIFPITGTLVTAGGYLVLTFMTVDRPLWFLMMAMFFIGLGFGQAMQSLTLATQNAVDVTDMGVATSLGDLLPPDRRHARHRGAAVGAVRADADQGQRRDAEQGGPDQRAGRRTDPVGRLRTGQPGRDEPDLEPDRHPGEGAGADGARPGHRRRDAGRRRGRHAAGDRRRPGPGRRRCAAGRAGAGRDRRPGRRRQAGGRAEGARGGGPAGRRHRGRRQARRRLHRRHPARCGGGQGGADDDRQA